MIFLTEGLNPSLLNSGGFFAAEPPEKPTEMNGIAVKILIAVRPEIEAGEVTCCNGATSQQVAVEMEGETAEKIAESYKTVDC